MWISIIFFLSLLFRLAAVSEEECVCPKRFHPVCGSDALSYRSLCLLQCAARKNPDLKVAHNGTCCPQLTCSLDRNPICDNFGRTHHNDCFFSRARCLARKTTNAHRGECQNHEVQSENCLDKCSFHSVPVCDHLGNSHDSECQLEQANCYRRNEKKEELLLVWYTSCNKIDILLTGKELSNSTILPVEEAMEEFSERPDHSNSTENMPAELSDISPSRDTSVEFFPQPISSLKLYDITLPCSAADCDKSWNPVCDANNRTHKNLCLFKFYTCKINRIDGSTLVLLHEGECGSRKESLICKNCANEEDPVPVCDNLNHTHASLCVISRFNCLQRLNHKPERVLVNIGHCYIKSPVFSLENEKCPSKCSQEKKPVCDEAGVTHHNLCLFQRHNCLVRQAGRVAPMLRTIKECGNEEQLVELKTTASVELTVGDNSTIDDAEEEIYKKENSSDELLKNSENGTEKSRFECPLPMCIEDTSSPVCDSNGNYHENVCMFTYARCLSAQNGEFLTIDQDEQCLAAKCKETCENTTRFVCASDLNTYQNDCFFLKEKCKDNDLEVMFYDAPDSAFVCDSEDTSRSLCEYQMLSCFADKNKELNFTIQHIGKCCGSMDVCRNKTEELLCGKDRRTYRNSCELDLENCRNEKLMVPITEVDHEGECKVPVDTEEEGAFRVEEGFNFQEFKNITDAGECTDNCDNIYAPVCGTDEKTYTNLCNMQLSNCKSHSKVEVAYNGECCDRECSSNFDPVCDDEGTTHQNLCFFGQQRCISEKALNKNLTIAKFDACTNVCSMVCTKEYAPICGSNGLTYVNLCEMDRQNCFIEKNITTGTPVEIDYKGECCPDLRCDFAFAPVCDSDGITHANDCVFRQQQCIQSKKGYANISIQYQGQCCNQLCENDYSPVCDGKMTHENLCRFRIAQCEAERKGDTLALAYSGECCVQPTGNCQISGTLCDSLGQTHRNLCQFELKRCLMEKTAKKNLTVVHKGECCSIEACHKGDSPVCDSHGGTHASLCHFQNTQCIHNKIHPSNSIQFAYNGNCCMNNCGNEWEPVCDQHGTIYENSCKFHKKSCEQAKRKGGLLLETPCTERRIRRLVQSTKKVIL